MMTRTGKISVGPGRWLAVLAVCACLVVPAMSWAQHGEHGRGGGQHESRAHESHGSRGHGGRHFDRSRSGGREMRARQSNQSEARHQRQPEDRREMRDGQERGARPDYRQGRPETRGQEHFPQWWQQHRELSPQKQAEALRRQPGFRNLPQRQQRRLINRLRDFDRRSPAEQRRTLGRVEMFERLSPERKQEVRGASQALSRMPPQRQREIRQAFRELRQEPPQERHQMLHSQFGARFTPQERTVLGNLLSIEPYQGQDGGQGQQRQIPQPYFGKH